MTTRLGQALLVIAFGLGSAAAETPLLDYRQPMPSGEPIISPALKPVLLGAFRAHAPGSADVVVLGMAKGSFTKPGTDEALYLLADRRPAAADRGTAGSLQLIAAISGGRVTGSFAIPAEHRYQRIAASVDTDRDGRREVLLETSFYNMGQLSIAIDLAALEGSGVTIRQSLGDVLRDSCDNPRGTREKVASVITLGPDGRLIATPRTQPCRN